MSSETDAAFVVDMKHDGHLHQPSDLPTIIRLYQPPDKEAFVELNLDWINEHFTVEHTDREQLERLEETILEPGGRIVVAEAKGRVVGVGALQPPPHDPNDGRKWFEIVKLATERTHRGRGIGRRVLERLITESKSLGADAIWLETNSVLASAVRLYEFTGFEHLPAEEFWPTPYERCNVQMVLEF